MHNNDFIKICPLCNQCYQEQSAISRKDNCTKICSNCGIKEALFEFIHNKT